MNNEVSPYSSSGSSSTSFSRTTELHRLQFEDAWVQCESTDCLKWRRITVGESELLDDSTPWYCFLNPDKNRSSCDDPEEDFAREEKIASKLGLKFILSCLPEGSLVWGRMPGYCKWPAVICKDPHCGELASIDETNGEVLYYHLEYLGKKHSHSWLGARSVSLYSHTNPEQVDDALSVKSFKSTASQRGGKSRGRGRVIQKKPPTSSKTYGGVEKAIEEANLLLDVLPQTRLDVLQFRYKISEQKEDYTDDEDQAPMKIKAGSKPRVRHNSTKGKQGRNPQKTATTNRKPRKSLTPKKAIIPKKPTCGPNSKSYSVTEHNEAEIKSHNVEQKVPHTDSPRILRSTSSLGTPASLGSMNLCSPASDLSGKRRRIDTQLTSCTSMVGRSKEEKFQLDIEMYRRNEKAFDHDIRRYMDRTNQRLSAPPCWQDQMISHFQIFLAVYERGGYDVMCEKRLWRELYRELTGTAREGGGLTKQYYTRNLYPYEKYVMGHADAVTGPLPKKIPPKTTTEVKQEPQQPDGTTTALDKELKEIDRMLQNLEEQSIIYGTAVQTLRADTGGSCMPIMFYDDTPPTQGNSVKEADMTSEFGTVPGIESAQTVPQREYDKETDDEEEIIHQMQALQQQLSQFTQ